MRIRRTIQVSDLETSPFYLTGGRFELRRLHSRYDLVRAHRLRHRIFAEQLRWVPRSKDRLENDAYDGCSVHFGVFDGKDLVAYVRLITHGHAFMVEREFRCIIGNDYRIRKKRDTCELTRFCVSPEARHEVIQDPDGTFSLTSFLFKGVYQWCIERGIRFIYAVTDGVICRYLQMKGYCCQVIGVPKKMPDGVVARTLLFDWRVFELVNAVKRPGMLRWYAQSVMSLLPRANAIA